ncbi:hypothetical protein DYQ48_01055 [Xanthomonas hortorum]|nr:hypothetical protein DYQ48_01055 [Xanthomonas hortorum]
MLDGWRGRIHASRDQPLFLLPTGEGAPQERMRVRAKPRAISFQVRLRPVPSPQPLSRRERGLTVPSPHGRRCPAGADEGTCEARVISFQVWLRPVPSPQPLSRKERGLIS